MPPLDGSTALSTAYYESMSPGLLAREPSRLDTTQKAGEDWPTIYQALESRLASLRMWRWSWWSHWQELARYIEPRRSKWIITANTMDRGTPLNADIIDSTATIASNICASGIWSGLTSPSRPWFKLGILEGFMQLDAASSEWLEDTERRLYDVLGGSNFYQTMRQAFGDVVNFGTGPVVVYEDFEDIIRCYLPCAGEYFLNAGARLSVDTFYREYTLNVQAIVEQFALENCPTEVSQLWETGGGSLDTEFVVCHAIEPNTALSVRGSLKQIRVVPSEFAYREVYWLKGIPSQAELSRRGFNELPFMVARWSTVSNDAYGRSPAMDALGDIKQIQLETLRKAELMEKMARPPMIADVSMKNEPASIIPGGITYTNTQGANAGFRPAFEVNANGLTAMVADIASVKERIEKCFFVDVFMAITNMEGVQPKNELELTKRDLERLQVLGPFINQFETEFASPLIARVLGIMERARLLKPRPPSLQGKAIAPKYTSILTLAQRGAETANLAQFFAIGGALSSAAKAAGVADPLRTVDWDKSYHKYGSLLGVPDDLFYPPEVVAQHDQMRLKMTQQQAALSASLPAVTAAHTLSQTPVGGGQSALSAMLGGGAAPPAGAA